MRLRIDGGWVEYEAQGEGPAVLFLHAFPLGLFMWDAQAAALTPRYRVVRVDARGFGGSGLPGGPLTMERIADDAAAVLSELGIARAAVGGCSMGGYAALAFARRHPERLAALLLQDTKAGADDEAARQGRAVLARKVRDEGSSAAADALLGRLLGATTRRLRPQLAQELRRRILDTSPEAIASALEGLALRADSRPSLAAIAVPTLVLVGEEDEITPLAEAEALAAAIVGARLARIPEAGHLANLENPSAVNAAVLAFLEDVWRSHGSGH